MFFVLAVPRGSWDLSSLTRDWTPHPWQWKQCPNHWAAGEFPMIAFKLVLLKWHLCYCLWRQLESQLGFLQVPIQGGFLGSCHMEISTKEGNDGQIASPLSETRPDTPKTPTQWSIPPASMLLLVPFLGCGFSNFEMWFQVNAWVSSSCCSPFARSTWLFGVLYGSMQVSGLFVQLLWRNPLEFWWELYWMCILFWTEWTF